MTSDGTRRPALRHLTDEDLRLWNTVVRTIKPLRRHPPLSEPGEIAAVKPARPNPLPKPPRPHAGTEIRRPPAPLPALSPLARRERQRLAHGGMPIEAHIDLHGLTQSEAHSALGHFLRRAQADGARFALVITGKGSRLAETGSGRGILRRQVPLWLRLPEFRPYVVGFEDAHSSHGGEGALYVRIRRAQSDRNKYF